MKLYTREDPDIGIDLELYKKSTFTKRLNPHLKTTILIPGWFGSCNKGNFRKLRLALLKTVNLNVWC